MRILRAGPFAGVGGSGLRTNLSLSDIGIDDINNEFFTSGAPVNCAHSSVVGWLAGARYQSEELGDPYNDVVRYESPSSVVTFADIFTLNVNRGARHDWRMFFWYQASVPFKATINWDCFTKRATPNGSSGASTSGGFFYGASYVPLWSESQSDFPVPPATDSYAEAISTGTYTVTLPASVVPFSCTLSGVNIGSGSDGNSDMQSDVSILLEPL